MGGDVQPSSGAPPERIDPKSTWNVERFNVPTCSVQQLTPKSCDLFIGDAETVADVGLHGSVVGYCLLQGTVDVRALQDYLMNGLLITGVTWSLKFQASPKESGRTTE